MAKNIMESRSFCNPLTIESLIDNLRKANEVSDESIFRAPVAVVPLEIYEDKNKMDLIKICLLGN